MREQQAGLLHRRRPAQDLRPEPQQCQRHQERPRLPEDRAEQRPDQRENVRSDAKSAFAPQTTALKNSLSALDAAVKSAQGQLSIASLATVSSSVTQVKNSANDLENAASGKCQ
jgi:hypothetical protein